MVQPDGNGDPVTCPQNLGSSGAAIWPWTIPSFADTLSIPVLSLRASVDLASWLQL